MSFIGKFLVAIDQLGNVLAGGNPDNTISARVGYFANFGVRRYRWYWKILEKIIDITFYPLDGKRHCLQAYYNDAGEEFKPGGYAWIYFFLNILIILSCIPLFVLFYLLFLLGVRPKENIKLTNLKRRLQASDRKLAGIKSEFKFTDLLADEEALALAEAVIQKAKKIKKKIEPRIAKESNL